MRKLAISTLAALALSAVGIHDAHAGKRVALARRTPVRQAKAQLDMAPPGSMDANAPGLLPADVPPLSNVPDVPYGPVAPEYPQRLDSGMPSLGGPVPPPEPFGGYLESAPAFTVIRQDLPFPNDSAPYRQSMIEVKIPSDARALLDGKEMELKNGVYVHAPRFSLWPGVPYKHDITVQRMSEAGVGASRTVTVYMRMGRLTELVFE